MNEFVREYLEKELVTLHEKIEKENKRWKEAQEQLQQQFAAETGAHQGFMVSYQERVEEINKLLNTDEEDKEE